MLQHRFSPRIVRASKALKYLSCVLALTAIGCQQQAFRVGQRTSVQFGTVSHVEQVRLQSDVPAGALIGGTLGLMTAGGSRNAPRNAIVGAAVGGLATSAIQGDRTGIAYTVMMLDGSTIRIISDQSEIHVGDCVAIERAGDTNNIRRENPAFCARANQTALTAIQRDSEAAAERCEAAKNELVQATTPEAVDTATRKVHLLCDW